MRLIGAQLVFFKTRPWIAAGGADGIVHVFEKNKLDGVVEMGGHEGEVVTIALSDDGRTLASCTCMRGAGGKWGWRPPRSDARLRAVAENNEVRIWRIDIA